MKELRAIDVRALLDVAIRQGGGVTAFAEAHGVSRQFLHQVMAGNRGPSQLICDALGIRPDGKRWVKEA